MVVGVYLEQKTALGNAALVSTENIIYERCLAKG